MYVIFNFSKDMNTFCFVCICCIFYLIKQHSRATLYILHAIHFKVYKSVQFVSANWKYLVHLNVPRYITDHLPHIAQMAHSKLEAGSELVIVVDRANFAERK